MIRGTTTLIAHFSDQIAPVKSPMIYNPYFETMPHKVTTVELVHDITIAVRIAGSCNAVLRRPDGSLLGDLFDGAGFVRGAHRRGFCFSGCLIQIGTDMLFEQIPLYLEFFGFGKATPDELCAVAMLA